MEEEEDKGECEWDQDDEDKDKDDLPPEQPMPQWTALYTVRPCYVFYHQNMQCPDEAWL